MDKLNNYFDESYIKFVDSDKRGATCFEEAQFIIKILQSLLNVEHILDHCCGHGRHLSHLTNNITNINFTGIDINPTFIKHANQLLKQKRVSLLCDDALNFLVINKFDFIYNIGSSLVSFSKNEIVKVFSNIFLSLKHGGYFLAHVFNPKYAKEKLPPKTWSLYADGNYVLEQKKFLNNETGVINQIRLLDDGNGNLKKHSVEIKITLFNQKNLENLLITAGFTEIQFYGDFTLNNYEELSPYIIALCKKP